MNHPSVLATPYRIKNLTLKNRLTMAPLFLGYANPDGTINQLLIDHYKQMASSGAAMIVVENVTVDPSGSGSPFTLRADDDRFIAGLATLAETIKTQGALAFAQINHAGRFAFEPQRMAPSAFKTGEVTPWAMTPEDMDKVARAFADAAQRIKAAGFDGLEIHGGTGYLLVQFLSPRTNLRTDEYGGSLENRMRFPLRVVDAVIHAVSHAYPVGYRFLADEWQADGLHVVDTAPYAQALERRGIAYLSVMAGTYDAFTRRDYNAAEKQEGFMAHFAGEIKAQAPGTPIIAAGRIQTPATAATLIEQGTTDLIGLARVLLADPLWPRKALGEVSDPIVVCELTCSLCLNRVMSGKPAFCSQWDKATRDAFLQRIGEKAAVK